MALVEVYHVVANEIAIDAVNATNIPQGSLVGLDANGNCVIANEDASILAVGLAGDSRSSGITSFTPESGSAQSRNPTTSMTGSLVIGAQGAQQKFTENHVADGYNEVLASGKMTVYQNGGVFWTDQYELTWAGGTTVADYTPGTHLYASGASETIGTAAGEFANPGGRFTDEVSSTAQVVGMTLRSPVAYPSGVPGTDTAFAALPEGGNSISFGTMLNLKLSI